MKVELKHLAPYLPYKLQIWEKCLTELNGEDPEIMIGIVGNRIFIEGCHKNGYANIQDVKPILRPISDMGKYIQIGRGKHIPMHLLMQEIFGSAITFYGDPLESIDEISLRSHWNNERVFQNLIIEKNSFNMINTSARISEHIRDRIKDVPDQVKIMQKLFEWHFDVFGLIEQGLAIDINTLTPINQ